ncbi:Protein CBG08331 [Caenorhabditis briggsae]|uniref:Protein CBG08331 n=1 Tax=Caenorhabditis briggsae TaxID=6238 RepID=A8X6B6_CAEBR|nr:Protein CBG08331 [Caenorhabditis briggsae]CAP28177.1 Protein CBG08331 [Caenorhabditis briggsae]
MNRVLLLLFFLLVGIWCDHPVSSEEKQYWKANCGTKPYHPRRFESRMVGIGFYIRAAVGSIL